VRRGLEEGVDISAKGVNGDALQAASRRVNGAVVQLLLDKGADVSAQGGYYG